MHFTELHPSQTQRRACEKMALTGPLSLTHKSPRPCEQIQQLELQHPYCTQPPTTVALLEIAINTTKACAIGQRDNDKVRVSSMLSIRPLIDR
jgi:hypothetical protein